ncbi:MAG: GxxExxY protein [Anaerolineaceae bacterium]|nr:GxxExxY protein [Anaerolineaceae bacterium]
MTENELATIIVDTAFKIHKQVGPGLLESAYQAILAYELKKAGLQIETEVPMPMVYDGIQIELGFRADIIVEDKVIIELKSVEKIAPVHYEQLLTYLRVADKRLGLLINFGEVLIKTGISRVVNGLPEGNVHSTSQRVRRQS